MERQNSSENLRPELAVPFIAAIRSETKNKIPGHERSLDIVFDEINKQTIETFQVNDSERFPGVRFSSIHLSVTPELISKINPQTIDQKSNATEGKVEGEMKRYAYFLQPAFGVHPGGNAHSVLDLGIDRFVREMPKVLGALRRGEKPPQIDIYLVGAPHGFGGRVTREWIDEIKKRGFEPHGELYAEFAQNHLPRNAEELGKTVIILQGVSKGAITGEETSRSLSQEIKTNAKIVQRLYDGPVGNHERNLLSQIVKSANMSVGMIGEIAVRMAGVVVGTDITGKILSQTEPQFYKEMARKLNLMPDDAEQSKLKVDCLLPEALALGRGNPLDKSERTFIRQPEIDPSNLNVENLKRILLNDLRLFGRKKFIASENGKVFNVPTSRKLHFFAHKKSFNRWGQIMSSIENNP